MRGLRRIGKVISEQDREKQVFKHVARYGQRPETEAVYAEAIHACESIEYIGYDVADIARIYNVDAQCLRNQLKRHFPDIIPSRDAMRRQLGLIGKDGNRGLKPATVNKYAAAIETLRNPAITVKQAARQHGVSYQGLQQHLIFYHKDIADGRLLARTDSLLRPAAAGTVSGKGGICEPREETKARYAPAVELYRTTDLPVTEIAARCGLAPHNLESYLRKWHRDEMLERQRIREENLAMKREAAKNRPDRSKAAVARQKYTPAIALLRKGKSLKEAADTLGVAQGNLCSWLKRNHPEVLSECKAGMMHLADGQLVSRSTYARYAPVAEYMSTHPSKPSAYVAAKFGVPLSSMQKHMSGYYPDIWERHCRFCAAKARKDHEKRKAEKAAQEKASKPVPVIEKTAAKYADAITAFAIGDKPLTQVAEEFALPASAFGTYIRSHHPELLENRRKVYAARLAEAARQREAAHEAQKQEYELRKAQRRLSVIPKYEPAVEEYRKGNIALKPLADKLGLCNVSLRNYIGTRYPELIDARAAAVRAELDRKYAAAMDDVLSTSDSLQKIARRHALSLNALRNYIQQHRPHLMDIHKTVMADASRTRKSDL